MKEKIERWLSSLGYDGTKSVALYPDDVERLRGLLSLYKAERIPCPKCNDIKLVVEEQGGGSVLRSCDCERWDRI